jgi:hypothetical protein
MPMFVPQMLADRPNTYTHQLRDLWCSVLLQAVDDLRGRQDDTDKYSSHQRSVRQANARAWFMSKNTEPKSFTWICSIIGTDPTRIRTKLLSQC